MSNTKAVQAIEHHITFPMGPMRLRTILMGINLEVKIPGMRMTRKAPKCSTILRKEFGLSGKPPALAVQFFDLLAKYGILDNLEPEDLAGSQPEATA